MTEYGATSDGFAIHDPSVDSMFEEYQKPRSLYLVVTNESDEPIGGGGIAPLRGADETICELQKMYFLRDARGKGLGHALLLELLGSARKFGFKTCYLETTGTMKEARAPYEKMGFKPQEKPLGSTGHNACECWMEMALLKPNIYYN